MAVPRLLYPIVAEERYPELLDNFGFNLIVEKKRIGKTAGNLVRNRILQGELVLIVTSANLDTLCRFKIDDEDSNLMPYGYSPNGHDPWGLLDVFKDWKDLYKIMTTGL